jgi:hypothetical protein
MKELEAIQELTKTAKLMQAKAWEEGVRNWAWWKDGVEYVGTCGTTLKNALLKNPYKKEN